MYHALVHCLLHRLGSCCGRSLTAVRWAGEYVAARRHCFFTWDERGPIPEVRVDEFKAVVHALCRLVGARVIAVTERSVTPNFHQAVLQWRQRDVAILCNSTLPLLAFAEPPVACGELIFCDHPELCSALASLGGYETFPAAELERSVSPTDLSHLDAVEREHASYWMPQRIGDLVFNWWD